MAVEQYKYKIGTYELPVEAYPTDIQLSSNLVTKSWNNMKGQFQDIPVNHKLKWNWNWTHIDTPSLEAMMTYIFNQIEDASNPSRFFDINGYFPGKGWVLRKCYLGTPTNFSSLGANVGGKIGEPGWWKCELHWIEVDGTVLLQPGTNLENNRGIIVGNRKIEVATSEDIHNILQEAS